MALTFTRQLSGADAWHQSCHGGAPSCGILLARLPQTPLSSSPPLGRVCPAPLLSRVPCLAGRVQKMCPIHVGAPLSTLNAPSVDPRRNRLLLRGAMQVGKPRRLGDGPGGDGFRRRVAFRRTLVVTYAMRRLRASGSRAPSLAALRPMGAVGNVVWERLPAHPGGTWPHPQYMFRIESSAPARGPWNPSMRPRNCRPWGRRSGGARPSTPRPTRPPYVGRISWPS